MRFPALRFCLACAALPFLAGCDGDASAASSDQAVAFGFSLEYGGREFSYSALKVGGARIVLDGVDIAVDPGLGVHIKPEILASKAGVETPLKPPFAALRHGDLDIVDGRLQIGDARYGSVAKGSHVTIDSEGVHVNGRARGELVESRPR